MERQWPSPRVASGKKATPPPREKRKKGAPLPTLREVLVCGGALAFGALYRGMARANQPPLPEGIKPPFPLATRLLEELCGWCGANRPNVVVIAMGLFAAGFAIRFAFQNYFYYLAIAVGLVVGFTWYSTAAPVERLIQSVEENLPKR